MSLGSLFGSMASLATSLMVSVRLVLGLENTPSAKLMSAASTLRRCAAIALPLVAIPLGARRARRSADSGRARSAGAFAHEDLICVALDVMHLLRIDPEAVAHDLLENRLVALPLGDATGEQRRCPRLVEPD